MNSKLRWLQDNLIPVRSIDPLDEDFSDLEPLREVFGKARVVMLGEQTHGDGATFYAKTRLVKFLHQRMGFDILAFESGLYECARAWWQMVNHQNSADSIRKALFGVWASSVQCQRLMDYLVINSQKPRPLELSGFDCQFSGRIAEEHFIDDLQAIAALPMPEEVEICLREILGGYYYGKPAPKATIQALFFGYLRRVRQQLAQDSALTSGRWVRILDGLILDMRRLWNRLEAVKSSNLRDRQMARNLLWLLREAYPGRRVIVWTATYHASRNYHTIYRPGSRSENYRQFVPMGHHVKKVLKGKCYSLGFTSFKGAWGVYRNPPRPLSVPKRFDIESHLGQTSFEQGFLNLNDLPEVHWLNNAAVARPMGYTRMKAAWPQVLDGIFYIRRMFPSEALGHRPG